MFSSLILISAPAAQFRVFHKLHFAKKKMQYQYAPLTGVYKRDMKEFFPKTSLEGLATWSKKAKIDQNRRSGRMTVT